MIHTNIDLEKSLLDGDRRTAYVELGKYLGLSHGNLQRLTHEELEMNLVATIHRAFGCDYTSIHYIV